MFRSITFNGTHKKNIGAPIIRKMKDMIVQMNLQYERHYKLNKDKLRKEKEYQEYLKQQELLKFRREHLIQLLREYFEKNKAEMNSPPPKKQKKKKKRAKSFNILANKERKYLYLKITRHNFFFLQYKPCLLPIPAKEKKKKDYLKTEISNNQRFNFKFMTISQIKKFVDLFGYVPLVISDKQAQEKKKKAENKKKFEANQNNSMNNNNTSNKNNKEKGNTENTQNANNNTGSFSNLENLNIFGNIGILPNAVNLSNIAKLSHGSNLLYPKKRYLTPKFTRTGCVFIPSKINLFQSSDKKNSNDKFLKRYKLLSAYNAKKNDTISRNTIHLPDAFSSNNQKYITIKKCNILNNSNKYKNQRASSVRTINNDRYRIEKNHYIRIKKRISIDCLKKKSFQLKSDCLSALKKSDILSKDLQFLNKIYNKLNENAKEKKEEISKAYFKKIEYKSFFKIYQKDIKPDMAKEKSKEYQHIVDKDGKIEINQKEFLRKPRSKLSFVQEYNQKREHQKLNSKFINEDEDEFSRCADMKNCINIIKPYFHTSKKKNVSFLLK